MRLLDLFCGAGGAAMGYHLAGFDDITGVDIKPQPHYPFKFIQGDAMDFMEKHWQEYDAIHASPPCQRYSLGTQRWNPEDYPDLLNNVEMFLSARSKPFVIENVERAPFTLPTITLCGIQYGLDVIRHRKFAANWMLFNFPHIIKHPVRGEFVTCAGHGGNGSNSLKVWRKAMQIDWMDKQELAEAIPPAYTRFIGHQLKRVIENELYTPESIWNYNQAKMQEMEAA